VTVSIADFLDSSEHIDTAERTALNGFNGLHGGVAVAMLVRRMRTMVPTGRELVAVTARFIRPLAGPMIVDTDLERNGSVLSVVRSTAASDKGTSVEAVGTFGTSASRDITTFAPEMPAGIRSRADAAPIDFPVEFVPIFERMEIRAATEELPYSGAAQPVLCGWVRLRDYVALNDERVMILIDALAPSYSAVLTELKAVPTVELSVQLSDGVIDAEFDWVLVRAQTTHIDARGFVRETIDVWAEGGRHLASCTQLRIVRW
jgi:hypothetical protein